MALCALDPMPTMAMTEAVPITIAMVVSNERIRFALIASMAVEIDSCNIIFYPNRPLTRSENLC